MNTETPHPGGLQISPKSQHPTTAFVPCFPQESPRGPAGTGLVSKLTEDGMDAGPTAPGLCCSRHPRRGSMSVPSLGGLGGDPHVGVWVMQLSPLSPPGLRCAFRSLPAFLVGLVRSRLGTCGQGVCRQHWSEVQVRMFPRLWTSASWEVGRECCLASC
uniref:Uncharacterized protein n=1 Tax=Pipistrellus kuhlii TaxID=59472 RepID=A0A7J7TA62_PIPKU|nr:hypothetical protein mPipKuh1_009671 [Pipistrellus kuhlii]